MRDRIIVMDGSPIVAVDTFGGDLADRIHLLDPVQIRFLVGDVPAFEGLVADVQLDISFPFVKVVPDCIWPVQESQVAIFGCDLGHAACCQDERISAQSSKETIEGTLEKKKKRRSSPRSA